MQVFLVSPIYSYIIATYSVNVDWFAMSYSRHHAYRGVRCGIFQPALSPRFPSISVRSRFFFLCGVEVGVALYVHRNFSLDDIYYTRRYQPPSSLSLPHSVFLHSFHFLIPSISFLLAFLRREARMLNEKVFPCP